MNSIQFFTLITGASQGIGKCMAIECASRGMNLFLIALDNHYLSQTEQEIKSRFDIQVITLGIDLTDNQAPEKIFEFAKNNNIRINTLINNAGLGSGGLFEKSDIELNRDIIRVNTQAMMGLTYYFINELRNNAPSHILNVSSMEATLPLPYKAVYTGTKNFIFSFSLALKEEIRGTGITMSILCPGPVLTNEDGLKRIQSQGKKAKLMVMMPEVVANMAIKGMLAGKSVIIPGIIPKSIVRIMGMFPLKLKMRILEKVFRAYRDHIPERKKMVIDDEIK